MMTDLFLSLLGISLSASLVIAAMLLFSPLLDRRYAAGWKYWVWILLALRLALPLNAGEFSAGAASLTRVTKAPPAVLRQEELQFPQSARIVLELPAVMAAPIALYPGREGADVTLLDMAAILWGIGCLGFILFHLLGGMCHRWVVGRRGRRIEDSGIAEQLSLLYTELGIRRSITPLWYPGAASPMVIGLLKPVLVLPKGKYSEEELYFVLKHELIHLKRHDVLVKLLFILANAMHWFNPLVWLMRVRAAADMEMSCDERVVRGAAYLVRRAYTEALLSVVRREAARADTLSAQLCGGGRTMRRRFENILEGGKKKRGVLLLVCVSALTAGIGGWIGCSVTEAGGWLEEVYQYPRDESIVEAALENMGSVRKGLMHNSFVDIQYAYAVYAVDERSYVVRYTRDGGNSWDKLLLSFSHECQGKAINMDGTVFRADDEDTVWNRVAVKYGEFPRVRLTSEKDLSYSDLRAGRRY